MKNLTKNLTLPFSHQDTITNLSAQKLTEAELDLLKNGLDFSMRHPDLNKSDILGTFEMIHYAMKEKLKDKDKC